MKTISLKIEQSIFDETEKIVSTMNISRNRYINDALNSFNQTQKRKALEKKLTKESLLVKKESMKILKEFEKIEGNDN